MSTRDSWMSWAAAVALVTLAAACAHGSSELRSQSAGRGAPSVESTAKGAMLVVRNNNFADMDVYAIRDGIVQQRLGMVTGLSAASFPLRSSLFPDGTLQLAGRLIGGGGTVRSDALTVWPGQTVTFTVQPYLAASMAIVR